MPPGFAAPEARANQGDAARGAGFWTQCKGCHETAPDRPTLTGILGRRAAGNAGFRYSKNMARIGTDGSVRGWGTLDAHIENRKASAKRMTCRGVKCANTCWSLFAPGDAVKVGAHCEPTPGKIASVESFISQTGEAAEPRRASHEESLGWCAGITTDILGWRPNCAKGRCAPADPQPALRRRGRARQWQVAVSAVDRGADGPGIDGAPLTGAHRCNRGPVSRVQALRHVVAPRKRDASVGVTPVSA